ncbi:outer membrane protein (porin) [Nitrosomonas sp. PY1]|uniref:porin n=1 Tax=Nitrosomonas sp. PY1 TaxID=1803906 RepID=UPI001FC7D08F|nr:porin [Nitrosomonas sp. PY1]GKS69888.1 outer membrane protein (porin) [Nitrosomonas sp. PY1]
MKKKLISLAVAGALATPMVASAQGTNVTLFGSVQAEYATVNKDGQSSQALIGDETGRSKFGAQITEELGGGLKAKARVEYGFSTGSGALGIARERWVGLANDQWGEMKLGRVQSPFKDFAGGMTIDPFAYTTLQASGSGGLMTASANGLGSGASSFVNSAARYDSPRVEGFSMAAILMPGDANRLDPSNFYPATSSQGGSQSNSGGEDGEWDFQVAGKYDAKIQDHDFGVFGGYSRDNISKRQQATLGTTSNEHVWRGGAFWSFRNFRLGGQYERVTNAIGAATCSNQAALGNPATGLGDTYGQCNSAMHLGGNGQLWFVGGQYDWGNTSLVAQGGMSQANSTTNLAPGAVGDLAKREFSQFTVGLIHNLSKRSSLFGGYQRGMVDDKAGNSTSLFRDSNTYTVGMRHNF